MVRLLINRLTQKLKSQNVEGNLAQELEGECVTFKEVRSVSVLNTSQSSLPFMLGEDQSEAVNEFDLTNMPNLLIAGLRSEPSGQQDVLKLILLSLIKVQPDNLRLILLGSKRSEMLDFCDIPHLLTPVDNDSKKAMNALNWALNEAFKRRQIMDSLRAQNIDEFNCKVTMQNPDQKRLPYIVVVIRELSELDKGLRDQMIAQLSQLSRKVGIHLIVATNHKSEDVITDLLKAYIPARISFKTNTETESIGILDIEGAERLEHGNMLFLPPGQMNPYEIRPTQLKPDQVEDILRSINRSDNNVEYLDEVTNPPPDLEQVFHGREMTPYFNQTVEFMFAKGLVSISMLQSELNVGYCKTVRILEEMMAIGAVAIEPSTEEQVLYRLNYSC